MATTNIWKGFKEFLGMSKPNPEMNKSRYSLVSSGDLNANTLQVWLSLPEEVKNDEAWAPFRQVYEKEFGNSRGPNIGMQNDDVRVTTRVPLVKSAPNLAEDFATWQKDNCDVTTDKAGDIKSLEKSPAVKMKIDKINRAKYYIKVTILLACWCFFTIIFMTHDVKDISTTLTSVDAENTKELKLDNSNNPDTWLSMSLTLKGPFLSEPSEIKMNASDKERIDKINVWIEKLNGTDNETAEGHKVSETWTLYLQDFSKSAFNNDISRFRELSLRAKSDSEAIYSIKINTSKIETTALTISYKLNPLDGSTGVIFACVLLAGLYILIIFEVVNRTMAAMIVSTMSLAALAITGDRPTLPEVISWLDEETLLLLFSMMLLVAIMAETGVFDFLAVFTFQVTKGKLWPLVYLLCAITAVLSTILDNVTTVLLMSPVTIRLCEVMELDPVPILMFMAIFSNIGGTATPVGDPPNVIVASNDAVIEAGINFTNFTAHMALGILLVSIQTAIQIRLMYRDTNKLRLAVPQEIQELTRQISIWRRAADSLPNLSRDVQVVRERLERKIRKLTVQLDALVKENSNRACPKETFQRTLEELKDKYKIRDKSLLIKTSVATAFVVIVFFLHSVPDLNRVSLSWTALLGAILLLTLADREDLEPILHRVEWSTLLFFAALFVLMEALSKLGLIVYIGGIMEFLILGVEENVRLAVAILLIIWVSGMISAFVDNIPLTTMMVRVVVAIGSNPILNLPMPPLIWALLFGACLGGNGTLIGASANVVCAGVAEQHGYKFTFSRFFKVGFPIMIGHLVVASAYLLICHCVFEWH